MPAEVEIPVVPAAGRRNGSRPAHDRVHAADGTDLRRTRRVLVVLGVVAVGVVVGYLTLDIAGSWEFALRLRSRRVISMALVASAVATSTVLFQSVTRNRILSPSIMGFDSLYVLIQTGSVYLFGSLALVQLDRRLMFLGQAVVMVAFAAALHRWLFDRRSSDLYVLVLVGIVFGTMFGSITTLVNRLIDPNEFATLQDRLFARFTTVEVDLLGLSAVVVAVGSVAAWRLGRRLDVVALGREPATSLGVDHRAVVDRALVVVAVLVAVATALVGPITFLGLLVANLARQALGTARHHSTLPAATLIAVIALVGGQLLLERVFSFNTSLSVIINFVGGVYFIALLLREARR